MMQKNHILALVIWGVAGGAFSTALMADTGPKGGPKGAEMLERFEAMDADKDGKVTEAEIAAYHAARFAAADADGNGSLSAEELTAMQLARMQDRMADRSARMIERLDANADGQLSAEEMAKMGERKSPFERADADGDGGVTMEEARAAVEKGAKRGKHGRGEGRGDRGWWWMDAN
jgi:Ca2+-binding EF-hand superfamily protein